MVQHNHPDAGRIFYVSPGGSDIHDGLHPDSPFATIEQVNVLPLQPGDAVLFRRGGAYNGCLRPQSSGTADAPIVFGAYGTGAAPILRGGPDTDEQYALQPDRTALVAVKLNGVGNITLQDLHLDGAHFGVLMNNSLQQDFTGAALTISSCIFTNIGGYTCLTLADKAPELPPFYSNAIEIALRRRHPLSQLRITNCRFADCESAMHIDTCGQILIQDVMVDNMYREGVLFESCHATSESPSVIQRLTIRGTGMVYGKDWGTAGIQWNVCSHFVCEELDVSYTANGEYRNDMVGGDFEASNKHMIVRNSRIHHNAGEGWLIYRTPGWGHDNHDIILENNVFACNGVKDEETAAFLRHFYNENTGGRMIGNKVWLAHPEQPLNFIAPETTDAYPGGYELGGNRVMGVYTLPARSLPADVLYSLDFDNPMDYGQWYPLNNVRWCYSNGLYLTIVIRQNNGDPTAVLSGDRLSIDLSRATHVQLRMKNKTGAGRINLDLSGADGRFHTGAVIPLSPAEDEFVTRTVALTFNPGLLRRIRLRLPVENAATGWVQIDHIRFLK